MNTTLLFFGRTIEITDMENGKFAFETDRDESGYVTAYDVVSATLRVQDLIVRAYERRADEGDAIAESLAPEE
jgi:hypothetical protein